MYTDGKTNKKNGMHWTNIHLFDMCFHESGRGVQKAVYRKSPYDRGENHPFKLFDVVKSYGHSYRIIDDKNYFLIADHEYVSGIKLINH